jgi:hypothetical protein
MRANERALRLRYPYSMNKVSLYIVYTVNFEGLTLLYYSPKIILYSYRGFVLTTWSYINGFN